MLLAGGGLRMGQVIGTTDSRGEHSRSQPIRYQNIFATLYHVLGIDPTQYVVDPVSVERGGMQQRSYDGLRAAGPEIGVGHVAADAGGFDEGSSAQDRDEWIRAAADW